MSAHPRGQESQDGQGTDVTDRVGRGLFLRHGLEGGLRIGRGGRISFAGDKRNTAAGLTGPLDCLDRVTLRTTVAERDDAVLGG